MTTEIDDLFAKLADHEIYGGCEHCDAYQTVESLVEPEPGLPGAWKVMVHHDDWCPWWQQRQARDARRASHRAERRRR